MSARVRAVSFLESVCRVVGLVEGLDVGDASSDIGDTVHTKRTTREKSEDDVCVLCMG